MLQGPDREERAEGSGKRNPRADEQEPDTRRRKLRGERAYDREAPVTKEPDVDPAAAWGSSRSYPGRSRLCPKGRRREAVREVSRGRSSRGTSAKGRTERRAKRP